MPLNATGAAHLRSPTGAWAYGIPRYSETLESFLAACPLTGPLLVLTVCPTVQFEDCRCSTRAEADAEHAVTRVRRIEDFILNVVLKLTEEDA